MPDRSGFYKALKWLQPVRYSFGILSGNLLQFANLKMAYSYLYRVDLLFLNMGCFSSSQTANVYKRLAERFFMILMTPTQNIK